MTAAALRSDAPAEAPAEDEFEQIAQALGQTDRGRRFMDAFASRVRASGTKEILAAVQAVGDAVTRQSHAIVSDVVRRELEDMASAIAQTRKDISAIKPTEAPPNSRILAATEELDAIVTATERATGDILGAAEKLQDICARLRDGQSAEGLAAELDDLSTQIFTACTFQDITGQRTTKVVNALRYLEQRVNAMIGMWTPEDGAGGAALPIVTPDDTRPDAHLLSGPASDGEGVSQEDIDALFK